ncbi:MAG: PBP1A family penicillin-binding protein [Deltaproteobacteria bacterium]|jgi:penicillin-binding protein 1A|nr:MAG: PBP1A family penicillin-binding protein [Deltaproteobacteria bacterium]
MLLTGGYSFYRVTRNLPQIASLQDYQPSIVTNVYADDGTPIAEFYIERRIVAPLEEIPQKLIWAFVAAEDSRFFEHEGIDFIGILRALWKNIRAGGIVQGGSTITQQVTKSLLLTPERSYTRKLREAILAYRIEKHLSKEEILYLYLNQIYLGHGAYGVGAAAQNYFGKQLEELNLAECATLAGLPQAPSRYSPYSHPQRAKERQVYVLNQMVSDGYISADEAAEALAYELEVKARKDWDIGKVPYFTEHIRRYLEEKYGREVLYRQGLQVYTTVNLAFQKAAQKAVKKGLYELDKRQGYRGPLAHLAPEEIEPFFQELKESVETNGGLEQGTVVKGVVIAVSSAEKKVSVRLSEGLGTLPVEKMEWARKPDPEIAYGAVKVTNPAKVLKVGDVILVRLLERDSETDNWLLALEQEPEVQGALLCMDNATGHVRAMVGGINFRTSQFNRAIQSRRQPGSAFKPFTYAAALDKGYTPATIIIDSPIIYTDDQMDWKWKPKNYKEKFYGPTLFRTALIFSRNVVTIKILRDIGIDYVIDYARRFGISSPLSRDLSLALGSSGVSLLELTNAYSVFANLGELVSPIFITKILDRQGNLLEEYRPQKERVLEKDTAYVMTHLLQEVVKYGTGWRARAVKRPTAGKTGTTNNLQDAWYIGFTPSYVTGVWVGFDGDRTLGKFETGSRAASPIWVDFTAEVLKDKREKVFTVPENVVFAKIDPKTGLLAKPGDENAVFEAFKEGTAPTKTSDETTPAMDEFFKGDLGTDPI